MSSNPSAHSKFCIHQRARDVGFLSRSPVPVAEGEPLRNTLREVEDNKVSKLHLAQHWNAAATAWARGAHRQASNIHARTLEQDRSIFQECRMVKMTVIRGGRKTGVPSELLGHGTGGLDRMMRKAAQGDAQVPNAAKRRSTNRSRMVDIYILHTLRRCTSTRRRNTTRDSPLPIERKTWKSWQLFTSLLHSRSRHTLRREPEAKALVTGGAEVQVTRVNRVIHRD